MKLRIIYENSEYEDLEDTDEFKSDGPYESCENCGLLYPNDFEDHEIRQILATNNNEGVLPSGWYERPEAPYEEGESTSYRQIYCPECHAKGYSDVRRDYLPRRVDPQNVDQFIKDYDWDSDEDRAPGESDETWQAYKQFRRKMLGLD